MEKLNSKQSLDLIGFSKFYYQHYFSLVNFTRIFYLPCDKFIVIIQANVKR